MSEKSKQGLTIQELKTYIGFEKLSEKELEQALRFIELMSEVLIETFK
tara:strand:- start:376 stop:519 length:144 start_codon:yes stop_codon:yes gene_type:complete